MTGKHHDAKIRRGTALALAAGYEPMDRARSIASTDTLSGHLNNALQIMQGADYFPLKFAPEGVQLAATFVFEAVEMAALETRIRAALLVLTTDPRYEVTPEGQSALARAQKGESK